MVEYEWVEIGKNSDTIVDIDKCAICPFNPYREDDYLDAIGVE